MRLYFFSPLEYPMTGRKRRTTRRKYKKQNISAISLRLLLFHYVFINYVNTYRNAFKSVPLSKALPVFKEIKSNTF
jgi:hypothetical protein